MSRELATIDFGVWNQRAGGILIATEYSAVILLKRRTHHLHTYVLLSSFFSTGSALGLLLVFRTNTAYNRFWEGRRIWERILNSLRDLGRMTVLYGDVIKSARVEKILHLLCAYPLGQSYEHDNLSRNRFISLYLWNRNDILEKKLSISLT